jgi:hypothetical protein
MSRLIDTSHQPAFFLSTALFFKTTDIAYFLIMLNRV